MVSIKGQNSGGWATRQCLFDKFLVTLTPLT